MDTKRIYEVDDDIINKIIQIQDKLKEQGIIIGLIGGAVRDILLGFKPNDLDFIILKGSLEDVINVYEKEEATIIKDGLAFKHVKILPKDETEYIEFSVSRKEAYNNDSRKPIVVDGTLEDEIKRRDFTINSLIMHSFSKQKDYVTYILHDNNNINDIYNKILRTNNEDAFQTLVDDPIRAMRALRFKEKYSLTVDPNLETALNKFYGSLFNKVAHERIYDELIKCLRAGVNLFEYDLIFNMFPDLMMLFAENEIEYEKENYKEVIEHIQKTLKSLTSEDEDYMYLAAFLHDIGKFFTQTFNETQNRYQYIDHENVSYYIAEQFLKHFKAPNSVKRKTLKIIEEHMKIKWFLNRKLSKKIAYVYDNLDCIFDILTFNTADWEGKPEEWYKEMNCAEIDQEIFRQCMIIFNYIPTREERLALKKGKEYTPEQYRNLIIQDIMSRVKKSVLWKE